MKLPVKITLRTFFLYISVYLLFPAFFLLVISAVYPALLAYWPYRLLLILLLVLAPVFVWLSAIFFSRFLGFQIGINVTKTAAGLFERKLANIRISELSQLAEQSRSLSEQSEQSWLANDTSALLLICDQSGKILRVNRGFEQITGYRENGVLGEDIFSLLSFSLPGTLPGEINSCLHENKSWKGEVWVKDSAGKSLALWLSATVSEKNLQPGMVFLGLDVTSQKKADAEIAFQAHYDSLTALANRNFFLHQLKDAVEQAQGRHLLMALLAIDIDNFRQINSSLGYEAGDLVLLKFSKKLQKTLRREDILARQEGDRFSVLMPEIKNAEDVVVAVRRIQETLQEPFSMQGRDYYLTTSIGISLYPYDSENAVDLLYKADAAMLLAKKQGKKQFQFYTSNLSSLAKKRVSLEMKLQQAAMDQDFVLHYQPIIDLESGTIGCFEALLRWKSEEGGLLPPSEFLSILEDTRLIIPVGIFVLQQACRQISALAESGFEHTRVSVNLSGSQLKDPDFVENLAEILQESKIRPEMLVLEINEHYILEGDARLFPVLQKVSELGVELAMDNFSTGYSSVVLLSRLPVKKIKIDRRIFEMGSAQAGPEKKLVTTVLAMASQLQLEIIASGVENAGQAQLLEEQHFRYLQGFYFSPPLPAADAVQMLRDHRIMYK